MGFKLGEGRFQSFKFAPPIYETQGYSYIENFGLMENLGSAISLKKSEIRVEFYKTTPRLVSNQTIMNKTIRRAQGNKEKLR